MKRYIPRPREIAQEYLQAYMMEHDLQPHENLPPEREMCAMWDLNRSTLRSAIARLISAGRLYAVQGSGTRVSPRFRRTMQDLQGFSEYAAACGLRARRGYYLLQKWNVISTSPDVCIGGWGRSCTVFLVCACSMIYRCS